MQSLVDFLGVKGDWKVQNIDEKMYLLLVRKTMDWSFGKFWPK